jgi:predicted transcriptional regulator
MKKSLYQIDQEYIILMEQMEEADGILDETLERMLDISEAELETKAEKYCMMIKQYEANVEARKSEIARMGKLNKTDQNIIDRLKENLSSSMRLHEKEKISGDLFTIGFRKSTKLAQAEDVDITKLDEKYLRKKVELDKSTITSALKAGEEIEGFSLEENKNLSIR